MLTKRLIKVVYKSICYIVYCLRYSNFKPYGHEVEFGHNGKFNTIKLETNENNLCESSGSENNNCDSKPLLSKNSSDVIQIMKEKESKYNSNNEEINININNEEENSINLNIINTKDDKTKNKSEDIKDNGEQDKNEIIIEKINKGGK